MKLVPEQWLNDFTVQTPTTTNKIEHNVVDNRSSEIWKLVTGAVTMGDHGEIVYPDGSRGSLVSTMTKYLTSPKRAQVERPYDVDRFLSVLIDVGVPANLLDQRFAHLFRTEDINIPASATQLTKSTWKRY